MISYFAAFLKKQSYGDSRFRKGRVGHTERYAEADMRVLEWGKVLMGYLCRV